MYRKYIPRRIVLYWEQPAGGYREISTNCSLNIAQTGCCMYIYIDIYFYVLNTVICQYYMYCMYIDIYLYILYVCIFIDIYLYVYCIVQAGCTLTFICMYRILTYACIHVHCTSMYLYAQNTVEFVIMGFQSVNTTPERTRLSRDITELRVIYTLRVVWIVTHGLKKQVTIKLLF